MAEKNPLLRPLCSSSRAPVRKPLSAEISRAVFFTKVHVLAASREAAHVLL